MELENHHFATKNDMMDLSNEHLYLLKPLSERLIENLKIGRSG